jgi:hypothetical protein
MEYITIDRKNFLAGATTSSESADGGFAPESYNLNPAYKAGVMYGTSTAVATTGDTPTGKLIASTSAQLTTPESFLISDDHKIYTFYSDALTLTATLATKQFEERVSSIIPFDGYFVAPTSVAGRDIVKINNNGTIATETWWSVTLGMGASLNTDTTDRPLLVYNKNLYVGDGYKIRKITPALAVSTSLVLDGLDNITAFGEDPATGYMLVAFQKAIKNSYINKSAPSYIGLYDGSSATFARIVPVQGKILAFFPVGGTVYVAYQQSIGIWTGTGIQFLRKLRRAIWFPSEQLRSDKFASVGTTLYFVDKDEIVAFGEIEQGQRSFRTIYRAENTIGMIRVNDLELVYSYQGNMKHIDVTSVSAGTYFQSLRYYAPDRIDIKEVEVTYDNAVTAGLTTATATILDEEDTARSVSIKNSSSSTKRVLSGRYSGPPTFSFTLQLSQTSGAYGWRRIRIGYLPAGKK